MSETPPPTPHDDQTMQLDDQDVEFEAADESEARDDDTLLEAEPEEAPDDLFLEADEPPPRRRGDASDESFAVSDQMAAAIAPAGSQMSSSIDPAAAQAARA